MIAVDVLYDEVERCRHLARGTEILIQGALPGKPTYRFVECITTVNSDYRLGIF